VKLDDRLKHLMKELGNAINESLSESERIAEAIGNIKQHGYDVFLVLEATIGFNKREEEGAGKDVPVTITDKQARVQFTRQDASFLRSLKIAVEEEDKN
jgi:hypothetical protein